MAGHDVHEWLLHMLIRIVLWVDRLWRRGCGWSGRSATSFCLPSRTCRDQVGPLMLLTRLRCAEHDCIGNNIVLMHICGVSGALRAPKSCSDLDAQIDLMLSSGSFDFSHFTTAQALLKHQCRLTGSCLAQSLCSRRFSISSQQPLQTAEAVV